MPARKSSPRSKPKSQSKRATSRVSLRVEGDIHCADFVGRDQHAK